MDPVAGSLMVWLGNETFRRFVFCLGCNGMNLYPYWSWMAGWCIVSTTLYPILSLLYSPVYPLLWKLCVLYPYPPCPLYPLAYPYTASASAPGLDSEREQLARLARRTWNITSYDVSCYNDMLLPVYSSYRPSFCYHLVLTWSKPLGYWGFSWVLRLLRQGVVK